ncbi:hypothetical protein H920_19366 [Fukomys damarensis]|uniref:Uncharacterized protein n=1 Tax=Fukomys damarensis TaxID=885580 RepID=A0A091CNY6_FUKDA|nr:hypothetical protein H920_19366 [Fukomys damarensis]
MGTVPRGVRQRAGEEQRSKRGLQVKPTGAARKRQSESIQPQAETMDDNVDNLHWLLRTSGAELKAAESRLLSEQEAGLGFLQAQSLGSWSTEGIS